MKNPTDNDLFNLILIDEKVKAIGVEVFGERVNQYYKWGEQNHDPITWIAILHEEVGEVSKAALQANFEGADISPYRAELIQTAAVCFQMVECFDRQNTFEITL